MSTPSTPSKPPTQPPLDLTNIQGDILGGLPKKTQTYVFFEVANVELFRTQLTKFIPHIKTVAQVIDDRDKIDKHKKSTDPHKPFLLPMVGVNIAFTHAGFTKMGIDDGSLAKNDAAFKSGQRADAEFLGDKGTGTGANFVPDWDPAFLKEIHGVFYVSGDSHTTIDKELAKIERIFGLDSSKASINEIIRIRGDVRPGENSGHEHFGFLDGISNPSIIGFDQKPAPGPSPVLPGIILTGREGDAAQADRAPWTVDGSFLAFRYLFQDVLKFDNFISTNTINVPGLLPQEDKDLFGARLVGRWKSGAPLDLAPFKDDDKLADDPNRINDFRFQAEGTFQKICPFAAHVRKTNPRADLEDKGFSIANRRIMRRGVQFGPEVTKQERRLKKTIQSRGLLFACFQSSIVDGFQFIQHSWANTTTFPPGTPQVPGFDPIIGQGKNRQMTGLDPNDPTKVISLPDEPWVQPRGGEYFFSPSLKGLKETIALAEEEV